MIKSNSNVANYACVDSHTSNMQNDKPNEKLSGELLSIARVEQAMRGWSSDGNAISVHRHIHVKHCTK